MTGRDIVIHTLSAAFVSFGNRLVTVRSILRIISFGDSYSLKINDQRFMFRAVENITRDRAPSTVCSEMRSVIILLRI